MGELASGHGKVMAGKGHKRSIDDISRLVSEHGGVAGDWQKTTSSTEIDAKPDCNCGLG